MDNLWAPWRGEYLNNPKSAGCILCNHTHTEKDKEHYIVFRNRLSFVMMNKFPYSNGHLMVSPYKHLPSLDELDDETMLELMQTTRLAIRVLKESYSPDGVNVGINNGKAAGAGIDKHLHVHIVPRWVGDVNFMSVFADIRVIPEHMQTSCEKLSGAFKKLAL